VRAGDLFVRDLDLVDLAAGVAPLLAVVGAEEVRASEAPVDGGLVDDQRIFNVKSLIGDDRDDEILACRPVVGTDRIGGLGEGERLLDVVEHVSPRVGAEFHVCRTEPERLLDHPGTHGDTRTGVVLGERNVRRTDTQDERGVDLEMRVLGGEIRFVDSDEEIFLLFGIDKLDRTFPRYVREGHLAVSEVFDIVSGHLRFAFADHDQWPARSAAIGVDDDIVVEFLVGDVDLGGDLAAPAHIAHPPHQVPGVIHEPDKSSVNEDT